jgi:oligopeptidase B
MNPPANSQTAGPVGPPRAKIVPKAIENHGDKRIDNYFWLREKENPEVRAYLEAENAYTAAVMKDTEDLQKKIYEEIVGRIQETDTSAPTRYDGWLYYTRTEKGKNYPIFCRKQGESAAEQILIDANQLAEGTKYFSIGIYSTSTDHKVLAYGTDTEGNEELTVRFKDLATGKLLGDELLKVSYGFEWAADNKTVFYVTEDAARRPYRLMRHTLGTPQAADTVLYEEKDERFRVGVEKTRSRAFILLGIASATSSEVHVLDANSPAGSFRLLVPRATDVEYDVAHHGDRFFIRTSDGAKTFRLVEAPVSDPSKKNWKELIPGRKDVTLEEVDAYKDHLVTVERDQGLRKIRIRRFSTGAEHFVEFPEPSYTMFAGGSADYDTTLLRFNYSSLTTPSSSFDYDMNTRQRTLVKRQPVLGGFDPSRYKTERMLAAAPDGTKVPVSLVYRKDLFKKDGSNPTLLYGYGSYGIPSDPGFNSQAISLLDRGFVYAIAHIRGGGDLGKLWHEDGRMLNKRNSFTDFIASAELLVRERYTSPSKLGILGGSAGGLLMGAVVNLRPDLFGAVIAKVPFVDVMSTMMDATLPLTVGEYEEWGNPADAKYYSYMRSYSPYDNIERQNFPNLLVTAGLNDPRVSYWEPAKWVAKLRALKKDNNLLLLKTNMSAGHGGASGRYEKFKETALDYAFLLKTLASSQNAR